MKKLILFTAILGLVAASCKKEPDSPPENVLDDSKAVTIDSLRGMQQAVSPGGISIIDSLHVYGIITMDESDGNLYKNLYMQDHTGAIQIRMLSTSDYAVGDSVRINLYGAYLSEYAGVIQLDSIDPDLMIVRLSAGNEVQPIVKTIPEITVADEGLLIRIDGVQFSGVELSNTYADHINQSSENRILEDCNANSIIVRTSGFANYAGQTVKQGNGSIVAIVSRFDSDIQLYIRSLEELTLNNPRCAGQMLFKDFEDDDIYSGGWDVVTVTGTEEWHTKYVGNTFANMTNYDQGTTTHSASESWYISPELDLTSSSNATLSFDNDTRYNGDPLVLLVSADYPGGGADPNLYTWDDISSLVSWDPDDNAWGFHPSGNIDLSTYVGQTINIAYKYTGSSSDGATWEIDNILVIG